MNTYYCKCGRTVQKNTAAENTGNRDVKGCDGCPYLMPWGKDKYIEGHGFVKDVQGYECRMSRDLDYATRFGGSVQDKCTCYIASLDFEFLERVSNWIAENYPNGEIFGSFCRANIRPTDYVSNGRYRMSIVCAQNKKGIAAKAALLERFFYPDGSRKDLTPEKERALIMSRIAAGKEFAHKKEDKLESRQYKNEYGTVFAVREKDGEPRLMCLSEDGLGNSRWAVSGVLAARTGDAKTEEELQAVLDRTAEELGWTLVEEPRITETPRPMPGDVYRSVKSGHLYKISELTNGKGTCYRTMRFNTNSCTWEPANSSIYPDMNNAKGEFESWIRIEQLEPVAPTGAAAATTGGNAASAESTAETSTTSESGEDANNSPGLPSAPADTSPQPPKAADAVPATRTTASSASGNGSLPAFDYSGLDDQTVQDLHLAEREFAGGKRMAEIGLRRMADGVAIAHDALCVTIATKCRNGKGAFSDSEKTFGRWCESVGLNRKAAERLLQVSKLFDSSSPRQQQVLEELSPSLLYAAAKPSAPAELVQAVKDGDITSNKQYQDLLARYNAERDAREQAEQERDEAATHIQAARDMQIDTARERDAALKEKAALARDCNRLGLEAEKARKDRDEAIKQRDAENTELKAKLRELESRPVEVAVAQPGDAQIEAWRKEGEERAAAALQDSVRKANQAKTDAQRQVADLQNQLSAARPDADTCQRTVDTLYETTENLRLLLRTQLRQAQLTPADYGNVVAHVLQAADALRDTVRSCAPAGYDFDSEEDDDFE